MRRILVLRGGALGDFIVTLPALAALRARWPAAEIELAGNATAAALAVARGILTAAHSQQEARWAELFSTGPLTPRFAAWLATYDLVVNFWPDPEGELARHFPRHPRQDFLTGSALPPTSPAAQHFINCLASLGVSGVAPHLLIEPLPAAVQGDSPAHGRIVVLHPGSGSPRKNWPLERWRELAAWLARDPRFELAIVAGPAEPPDPIPGIGRVLRERSLEELVGCLKRCTLFVGHDSGISHLAAAAGARGVLLWGATDAARWAPPTPRMTIVSAGGDLAALPLATVQSAVQAALS
jgi:heptosyltransferase-3